MLLVMGSSRQRLFLSLQIKGPKHVIYAPHLQGKGYRGVDKENAFFLFTITWAVRVAYQTQSGALTAGFIRQGL